MIVKSPYKKGRLCLDNRLVMASLNCHKAGEDGKVTKETIEWYRERGKGLGMVILEHSAVSRWDRPTDRVLCIDEDSDIPGLCLLTDALHREGQGSRFSWTTAADGFPLSFGGRSRPKSG